jgi:hypothetical protein
MRARSPTSEFTRFGLVFIYSHHYTLVISTSGAVFTDLTRRDVNARVNRGVHLLSTSIAIHYRVVPRFTAAFWIRGLGPYLQDGILSSGSSSRLQPVCRWTKGALTWKNLPRTHPALMKPIWYPPPPPHTHHPIWDPQSDFL